MTKEDFVDKINKVVVERTINGIKNNLISPSGRQPDKIWVDGSKWYNNLDDFTKTIVDNIIIDTSRATAFGFFAVLDQVRSIYDTVETQDNKRGELELFYNDENEKVMLNSDDANQLHDIFRSLY